MQVARELVEEFKGVRGFFPSEKAKRITWFDEDAGVMAREQMERGDGGGWGGRARKRRRDGDEIEMRVEEMQNRLLGSLEGVGTVHSTFDDFRFVFSFFVFPSGERADM